MEDYGCGRFTPLKVEHFRHLIKMHLAVAGAVLKRNKWMTPAYHYLDLTAGPGISPDDGTEQAPLVFVRESVDFPFEVRPVFFERDAVTYAALDAAFDRLKLGKPFQLCGIHADFRDQLVPVLAAMTRCDRGSALGLLYYDPLPGAEQLEGFRSLGEFSKGPLLERVDFLFNVSATTVKRMRQQASKRGWPHESLCDLLAGIDKKFWLVREPFGANQWTFLLGTNWADFKEYKRIHFHRADQPTGAEILRRLEYTRDELNGGREVV